MKLSRKKVCGWPVKTLVAGTLQFIHFFVAIFREDTHNFFFSGRTTKQKNIFISYDLKKMTRTSWNTRKINKKIVCAG